MKGIICYYSGSGNTKLACEYIKRNIKSVGFELYNIVKSEIPDLGEYDVVGFATFTDFGGAPQYFHSFFDKMKSQPGKLAFVFNTYGFLSGNTLKSLAELAEGKKFKVFSGYSLHTPENYPPQRVRKMAFDNSPNPKELKRFEKFISRLDELIGTIREGDLTTLDKVRNGKMSILFPKMKRTQAKKDFGEQNVDEVLCNECGICKKVCPYEAIELTPKPVFNHSKCNGCWACYNHCPEKAIYTKKYKGKGHYPKPNQQLIEKLGQ